MKRFCCLALLLGSFGGSVSCHQADRQPSSFPHNTSRMPPPTTTQARPVGKPVRLKDPAGVSIDFFESESAFDIYTRHLYDQIVIESDALKIEANRVSLASGTTALELKRTRDVKRVGAFWYDKVKVQLT